MKLAKFLFLPILAISQIANAAPNIQFECSVPTTIFSAHTEGDKVILEVNSPWGIQFTPMFRGSLAPTTLDKINVQRTLIERMGNKQTFTWPMSECIIRDGNIYNCSKGEHFEINGLKIRPISFSTYKYALSMAKGDFDIYTVEVVFVIDNASELTGLPPEKIGLNFSLSTDYSFARHCH